MNDMVCQQAGRFVPIDAALSTGLQMGGQQAKTGRLAQETPAALPVDHIDMGVDLPKFMKLG